MKTFVTLILASFTSIALANCRINLEARGLSGEQVAQVKVVLVAKNYTVAKKLSGNEIDLMIAINDGSASLCIPSVSDIYRVNGGFEIYSPALNIQVEKTGSYLRPFFHTRMFTQLKAQLRKMPACR